jgi:hypothetical protein
MCYYGTYLVIPIVIITFIFGILTVATLAMGSWPRQRLAKVQAKSEARESHFMLMGMWECGSVGECEGMNLHTPKWVPIVGVGVSMDFWIFKERF